MTIVRPPNLEKRETQRSYLHRLDTEYALIMAPSGELRARVLDSTPKGIGLVLEGPAARMPIPLKKGDLVPIRIERGGQWVEVQGRLATRSESLLEKEGLRLGFRIEADGELLRQTHGRMDDARPRRFSVMDGPLLESESEDPSRAGQMAFYTIRDLSLKGALLETSARNKFLLPNLKILMSIAIPAHGRFEEEVIVKRVESARDRYLLGVAFTGLKKETVKALTDFCVNFAQDVSYQLMLEEGFPARGLEESLTVEAVSSHKDFLQVTDLRLLNRHDRGLSLNITEPWSMLEQQDLDARHVLVKFGKKVMASARISETADGLLVERVVLDKEFTRAVRGERAERRLWQEVLKTALTSGHSKVVIKDELPQFMRDLGGRAVKKDYVLNIARLKWGRGCKLSTWAELVAPSIRELVAEKKLTITRILFWKLWALEKARIGLEKAQ
ncbi:MAG: hypothetical protein EOP10_01155 [Proteobacteria bacterium]|nr:MAG: hypothetical protein EOP10_01155 [Pseudomonadota bacterium]